ncbi:hypothetical protein ACJW30_10G012900 [Castanea mollissima]
MFKSSPATCVAACIGVWWRRFGQRGTSQTLSLLCCFRVYHCWIEVPSHFAKKMFILLSYLNVNLFRRAGSCRLHVGLFFNLSILASNISFNCRLLIGGLVLGIRQL